VALSVPARIIYWQLLVALAGALLWWALGGGRAALAAFCGGGIGALLTLYAASRAFRRTGGEPRAMLGALFRAEALKFVLAVGLFSVAAILFAGEILAVMTTFVVSLSGYWLALIWTADET